MIEEPARRPSSRKPRRALLVAVVVAAIAIGSAGTWFAWAVGGAGDGKAVQVTIPPGSSASSIAERLEAAGVIRSAFAFRLLTKIRGVAANFRPGTYRLEEGLSAAAAMDALKKGTPEEVMRFTIAEGLTVRQIARRVEEQTRIKAAQFLAALVRAEELPDALAGHVGERARKPEDFEGFLFPDTYEIFKNASADDVVAKMLRRFDEAAAEAGLAARGTTDAYELVVIASLIEKEARCREDLIQGKAPCANDHVYISSVIYNRLAKPMRLQIDATIQYVYIQRTGRAKNPLLTSDYQLDSPYNTYQHDGLPPTPIGVPGLESLRAAMRPAQTDFFFYRLCNPDALRYGHIFGRTIGERDSKWRNDPRCT